MRESRAMTVERVEQEQQGAELEVRREEPVGPMPASMLQQFAADARAAHLVAQSIARTTFVPTSYKKRGRDTWLDPSEVASNVTAAFLAGAEIGLKPMQALQAINIIEGTPALSALAMRALVTAAGHEMWIHEQSVERATMYVTMRGRRRGSENVVEVTWTLGRARQAGLLEKQNWQKDPLAMLIARCTSALARLIGPDVIMGLAYSAEELGDEDELPEEEVRELTGSSRRGQGAAGGLQRRPAVQEAPEPAQEEAAAVQEAPDAAQEPSVPEPVEQAPVACTEVHADGRRCTRAVGHEGKHYFGPKNSAPAEAVEPVAPVAGEPVNDGPGPDSGAPVADFEPTAEERAEQEEPLFVEPSDADLEAALEADRQAAAVAQVEQAIGGGEEPVVGELVEEEPPALVEPAAEDDPWADFQ